VGNKPLLLEVKLPYPHGMAAMIRLQALVRADKITLWPSDKYFWRLARRALTPDSRLSYTRVPITTRPFCPPRPPLWLTVGSRTEGFCLQLLFYHTCNLQQHPARLPLQGPRCPVASVRVQSAPDGVSFIALQSPSFIHSPFNLFTPSMPTPALSPC
jgi:hypothetical protein